MARYPTRRATSAGGVVCDDRADGRRWVLLIAAINAAGKAQWTLPKGGIEDGESDADAALREVLEETGHTATIDRLLGTIDYWFVWRPDSIRYHKYVHYFHMWWDGEPPCERDDEAEHVEWVPIDVALVRLAHRNERALVRKAMQVPARTAGARPGPRANGSSPRGDADNGSAPRDVPARAAAAQDGDTRPDLPEPTPSTSAADR